VGSLPFLGLACPFFRPPDDVASVTLSTKAVGGALNARGAGTIALRGTATTSAGRSAGTPFQVTISGVLLPSPPQRLTKPPDPNCVVVPDATEGNPAKAADLKRAAGFNPVFRSRPGPIHDPYVYRQLPLPGACVPSGSTVELYLQQGPVQ